MIEENPNKYQVSLIIPAFNEAKRIAKVLKPALKCKLLSEIIVIDDHSHDNTSDIVQQFDSVKCFRNKNNLGKQESLLVGAQKAKGDILLFLDADLKNLTSGHIEKLVLPIIEDKTYMTIASCSSINPKSKKLLVQFQTLILLSGQRCLKKENYQKVVKKEKPEGFEIELCLNKYFLENNKSIYIINLPLNHSTKTKKYGAFTGLKSNWKMNRNIIKKYGLIEFLKQLYKIDLPFFIKILNGGNVMEIKTKKEPQGK